MEGKVPMFIYAGIEEEKDKDYLHKSIGLLFSAASSINKRSKVTFSHPEQVRNMPRSLLVGSRVHTHIIMKGNKR